MAQFTDRAATAHLPQTSEIIAVVLPDGSPAPASVLDEHVVTGTMLVVRYADGRMALEPVKSAALLRRSADAQPARRRPILDPESHEVMGYELEVLS